MSGRNTAPASVGPKGRWERSTCPTWRSRAASCWENRLSLRDYAFIRDRIIVIPPGAITAVEGEGPAESVQITFRVDGGERVITIVNWREPRAPIDANLLESPRLDEMLREVVIALAPAPTNHG